MGYERISLRDHNPGNLRNRLTAAGCNQVYIDEVGPGMPCRTELDKMLDSLREGDVVVFTRLDHLGQSVKMVKEVADRIQAAGAGMRALDQNIDTTVPEGRLFFRILTAFAEWEHLMIAARTLDGLAAARARGRTGGRRKKLTTCQIERARQMNAATGPDGKRRYTVQQIADELGIKRTTLYGYLGTDQAAQRP
jgi:DNA invertase Pin-like site-specific DNA recombinase